MITNGADLLKAAPIHNMEISKIRQHGVSHGMGEAGYDIRIKQEIVFTKTAGGSRMIEVNDKNANALETLKG